MCHIICLGCIADLDLQDGPTKPLLLEDANHLPIGQSITRGKKGMNAYLVTDGHCSCDLFAAKEKHRNELWNKLDRFIESLFQEISIIWLVHHVYSGSFAEEAISPLERSKVYGWSNLGRRLDEDTLYVIYRDTLDRIAGNDAGNRP